MEYLIETRNTHSFPFDGLEEGVGHDFHETSLLVAAQAIGRVLVEEALQDGGGLHTQRPRNPDRLFKNNWKKSSRSMRE